MQGTDIVKYTVRRNGTPSTLPQLFGTYKDLRYRVLEGLGRKRSYHSSVDGKTYDSMLRLQKQLLSEMSQFHTVEINGEPYLVELVDDDNLFHKPSNIVYLRSRDGRKLVLREARRYSTNSEEMKALKMLFKESEKPDDKWYEMLLIDSKNAADNSPRPLPIPEAYILGAVKLLSLEHPILRVVPYFRPLDMTENRFWYIRDFLPQTNSTENRREVLANLWGLNLNIFPDSDPEGLMVYSDQNKPVVIDPDFIVYSKGRPMKREVHTLKKENNDVVIRDVSRLIARRREEIGNVKFVDFLPRDLDELRSVLFDNSFFTPE